MRTFFLILTILVVNSCSARRFGLDGGDLLPKAQRLDSQERSHRLLVNTGDIINIKVFREPDLAGVYRVNNQGEINFPYIGQVKLTGKNTHEIAEEIRARLSHGFLKNPHVTIFLRESNSQKIHLLGEISKAGSQGFQPGMTIIQALANAGGFTGLAATNRVRVTRVIQGIERKYVIPVGDIRNGNAPNFPLQPGDIVFVPESIF